MLFDLGDISAVPVKELLMASHVFVSHMNIDHFIGFDYLLRCSLRREDPLTIYGPEGILDIVQSKLQGYTWNLIKDYPLEIEVFEVYETHQLTASFYAAQGFKMTNPRTVNRSLTLLEEDYYAVKAAIFNHRIPVLGFSLEEDYHININKDLLDQWELPVGPWLKELKDAIRKGLHEKEFFIANDKYLLSELREIAIITKGHKIAYITDIALEQRNREAAIALAKNADILYIEGCFMDKDRDRALHRNHITAKEAGIIARKADVKRLELIHISPKYIAMPHEVIAEAMNEFNNIKETS
jgi:ribonuclease Z